MYNSMNEKQLQLPSIFYTHAQTYCLYAYTSTKIPPHAHHTPKYNHTIIHMQILTHTHLHKIPSHEHRTPLHTQMITYTKIVTR